MVDSAEMSAARPISLPLIVLDLFTLAQMLRAQETQQMSPMALAVLGSFAVGMRWPTEVVFAETPARDRDSSGKDSNRGSVESERASASAELDTSGAKPAGSGSGKQAESPVSRSSSFAASNLPLTASQQQVPSLKSASIFQMLDGPELELLVAAVLALSFFVIGWVCGGNYYLRRDRRPRSKIRL